jgi:hypothetical protein
MTPEDLMMVTDVLCFPEWYVIKLDINFSKFRGSPISPSSGAFILLPPTFTLMVKVVV